MKHAFQLASLSVAALALSAQAGKVKTFDINFNDYPANAAPSGSVAGGAWTLRTGDGSYVDVKSGSDNDKQLVLDAASNDPLTFAPSEATTTTIEMEVQFVGASEAPATSLAGTQAALYLHKTSGLQVSVAGGPFTAFVDDTTQQAPTVAETTWYKLTITFAYGTGTTIVLANAQGTTLATYKSASTVSGKSGVEGVDFYGSGFVDNFVGSCSYAIDSATDTDNDTSVDTASDTDMTIANGVLTTEFASNLAGTGALKFIKVTGTIGGEEVTRTLRVVNGNQAIAISAAHFTAVSKVVAYYGDAVTATAAGDAATAPAVVTTKEGTTKVTGSVTAKSGLYYGIVVNGTATALNGGAPVAPEHHGDTLNYEVPVSGTPYDVPYGVQKFKIVASDDPVTAQ